MNHFTVGSGCMQDGFKEDEIKNISKWHRYSRTNSNFIPCSQHYDYDYTTVEEPVRLPMLWPMLPL